tara:strand:+ start:469 stop:1134 length:666 start_codon:yes stop_codon:yes gene_type:complete
MTNEVLEASEVIGEILEDMDLPARDRAADLARTIELRIAKTRTAAQQIEAGDEDGAITSIGALHSVGGTEDVWKIAKMCADRNMKRALGISLKVAWSPVGAEGIPDHLTHEEVASWFRISARTTLMSPLENATLFNLGDRVLARTTVCSPLVNDRLMSWHPTTDDDGINSQRDDFFYDKSDASESEIYQRIHKSAVLAVFIDHLINGDQQEVELVVDSRRL